MPYSIGIGVLLEGVAFNELRALEMELAERVGNTNGLVQPPHITVKAPFSVPDYDTVRQVISAMEEIAERIPPFSIELNGFADFGGSVLFAKVTPNEEIRALHQHYLTRIEAIVPGARGQFEGDNVVFHSSIALGLNPPQFDNALKHLQQRWLRSYRRRVYAEKVGLFMNLNDQWIVVHETQLCG